MTSYTAKDWKKFADDCIVKSPKNECQTTCPICLDDIGPYDKFLKLSGCGHLICKNSICQDGLFANFSSCPLCRMPFKQEEAHNEISYPDWGPTSDPPPLRDMPEVGHEPWNEHLFSHDTCNEEPNSNSSWDEEEPISFNPWNEGLSYHNSCNIWYLMDYFLDENRSLGGW